MRQDQQIRAALVRLDDEAAPHVLPTSAEVCSRIRFRLAYRPRARRSIAHAGNLLAALFVLVFMLRMNWSGGLSESLVAVLAAAAAAAAFLFRFLSRSYGK